MPQHELSKGRLLDEKGNLNETGFAYKLVKEYNRKDIKGLKSRIKEWDYYYIGDQNYGIALTIDDNSYMGLVSISILDFNNKIDITKSIMYWLTFGSVNLPSSSEDGDIFKSGKNYSMYFQNKHGARRLICSMKNIVKGKDFSCDISLKETNPNSIVIATPFKKKRHFYYNQKINLLKANGYFKFGDLSYQFNKDAYGGLDWGRGVWTYSNTWYWSSLNGVYNNHRFAFNLGYGFGDTSAATENMLFIDDKAYKLNDVIFNIPKTKKNKDDYLSTWTMTSQSGDINLTFTPILDRKSNTNALVIQSDQHQVFGRFSGYFLLNGEKIEINDLIGFAEKVKNRW